MPKNYDRKDFLKFALLANAALYTSRLHSAIKVFSKLAPPSGPNVLYYKKGDIPYDQLRQGFNKRIDKFPKIIALCQNTEGVSEAIKYAIANQLPVAIKSGGHCMEGFSCNDGGMVINLSLLNKVEWLNNDSIQVGPGCTVSSLYDAILPKGKVVPAGSCASVGIGGLVLGGGYGILSRQLGLACDSLTEVTMVDGKGNIINSANDKELLWACKGGGNGNFGVITAMKFKTHTAPATLQCFRFKTHKIDTQKAKEILQNWFEATTTLPPSCFSAYVLNGKTAYILLTTTDKITPVLEPIIKKLSIFAEKVTQTQASPLEPALKTFYGIQHPVYFKNSSAGLYKKYADIESFIDKVLDTITASHGMIYQVNTLGGNIQNAVLESAAAFPHRAFSYFSELQTYWDTDNQADPLLKKFQDVQNIFSKNNITTQYRNYPDINFIHWEEKYYAKSYARLQQVKNKYDPDNLIRHPQSIKNA
jgi:hypothetical protein